MIVRISWLAAVFSSVAVTQGACAPSAQTEPDPHEAGSEPHGHGHDVVAITRFSDTLELFAEHPPAVVDQALPFLAHLTILDGFSALDDATVTLILDGPAPARGHVSESLRPGIFQPTVLIGKPGTYQGRLEVVSPTLKDTIDGFEIVVNADTHTAQSTDDASPAPQGRQISFLKEQQWQIPFATAFATHQPLVPTQDVLGEITTPPDGRADVSAGVAGRIVTGPGGLPRPGQSVRRGERLATIAPAPASPEAAAGADLAVVEAQARVQSSQAAVARAERLIADHAIAQRSVDDARRDLRVAHEALRAATRARDLFAGATQGRGGGLYRVTAPIDGIVVDVDATQGQSVTPGQRLVRIVDSRVLWVHARVPEQQAATLRTDEDAAFQIVSTDRWLPLRITGDDPPASIAYVGRTVDPRSRTVDLIYKLGESTQAYRVGAMVRVAVPMGVPWEGVVVADSALVNDDGRMVVYVQREGETFEERVVRIGPRHGGRVGLDHGVQAGERVVTRGAALLRLASRVGDNTASHGHVH